MAMTTRLRAVLYRFLRHASGERYPNARHKGGASFRDFPGQRNRAWGLLLGVSFSVPMLVAQTQARLEKAISAELLSADAASTVDVIVQYRFKPNNKHHEKLQSRGGILRAEFGAINSRAYSVPASALTDLANDPEVLYVSPNRPVQGLLDYAEPTTNALTAFNFGFDGSGVGVAVIDSGVSNHPDLTQKNGSGQRVVYKEDFVGGGTDDHFGHGQHVAGIIGSNASRSTGPGFTHTFRGIAPNVNLISLRVLDENGAGSDATVIAAINRAIALKKTYNIRVINLSLGRPVYESYALDPLCQAVEAAWRAGIVVVVAAGNEGRNNTFGTNGYATITAPGNDPLAITVGAMKDMKTVTLVLNRN